MSTSDEELLEKVFSVFQNKVTMATWDGELLKLLYETRMPTVSHTRIFTPRGCFFPSYQKLQVFCQSV
jgi:hypothetical protein